MKALTKEQIEYIELKTMFHRMQDTFDRMSKELECYTTIISKDYPCTNVVVEQFFYMSLEKSKQDKIKRLSNAKND